MSAPTQTRTPGGTASPSKQQMIAFAREVLNNRWVLFSENKIVRLVLRFQRRIPRASGWAFFLYLCAHAELSDEQKREALEDPDVKRFIKSYREDPTGWDAVNHVLRDRGW
jgi:hypothetical protein